MQNSIVSFVQEGSLGIITINRPEVLNALSRDVLAELGVILMKLRNDPTVKAIIITGSGDKAFVIGADIQAMAAMTADEGYEYSRFGQEVFALIEELPQPVIAAVNGYALGGGCEITLACDIRIASEKAKFGQPEINLGIIPGFGGTQRLPRLIGKTKAMELILTGEIIGAQEALNIELVNRVVAAEELMKTAKEIGNKICAKSRVAVQAVKNAVNKSLQTEPDLSYTVEAELFRVCFSSEDHLEGMRAFLEKRRPQFKDC